MNRDYLEQKSEKDKLAAARADAARQGEPNPPKRKGKKRKGKRQAAESAQEARPGADKGGWDAGSRRAPRK